MTNGRVEAAVIAPTASTPAVSVSARSTPVWLPITPISDGRATGRFGGLRPGVYAVAVLHDENQNDEMDFNFLGMPLEG